MPQEIYEKKFSSNERENSLEFHLYFWKYVYDRPKNALIDNNKVAPLLESDWGVTDLLFCVKDMVAEDESGPMQRASWPHVLKAKILELIG